MLEFFFFAAIFLVVLAVVGHVLWLIGAAFFRFVMGGPVETKDVERPGPRPSAETRIREDFLAAKRLIQYAKYTGWLSQEKIQELDQLLDNLQARSRGSSKPVAEPKATSSQVRAGTDQSNAPTVSPPVSVVTDERGNWSPAPLPVPQFNRDTSPTIAPPVSAAAPLAKDPPPSVPSTFQPLPRDAHALDQEYRDPQQSRPAVHKRLTADVIYAFMQKANVRWIELISAALIVICSTGLVISLWSTLAATSRFFPALIFCLVTMAIHAAGHYTLKQWKLRNTSRGILHIANMLIPLSVMAGLLLSVHADQSFTLGFASVAAIAIGTVVYGLLAIWTSRTLFAAQHWYVSSTIIAACISLLITHILRGYQNHSWAGYLASFGGLLACNAATAAAFTRLLGQRAAYHRSTSNRMQRMSYQIVFVTIAAMSFYAFRNRVGLLQESGYWLLAYFLISVWIIYGIHAISIFLKSRRHTTEATSDYARQPSRKGKPINFQLYTLVACAFVIFFLPLLVLALWQIADDRALLILAVSGITGWLIYLLQKSAIPISRLAIAIGSCATSTIVIEGLLNQERILRVQDWLEWPKVLALIISGIAAVVASVRIPQQWRKPVALAGTIHLVTATLLSSITAVLQILGIRNFATWPEIVMGTLGLGFLVAANARDIVESKSEDAVHANRSKLTIALAVLGLAFFSAFIFHLVQVNPFLESRLAAMRPIHSISIALGSISAVVSVIMLVRQAIPKWRIRSRLTTDRSSLATPMLLQMFAIATAIACAVQAWIPHDSFHRILTVGWCVPLSLFVLTTIKRHFAVNEVMRFVSGLWIGLAVFHVGYVYQWWQSWDAAYSTVILFAILSAAITLLYGVDRWLPAEERNYARLPVSEITAILGCAAIGFQVAPRAARQLLAGLNQAVIPPLVPNSLSEILILVLGSIGICVMPIIAYWVQSRRKPLSEALALIGGMVGVLSVLLAGWLIPAPYNLLVLLWLSLLLSLVYFVPANIGFWSRWKLSQKSIRIIGTTGGVLVLAISLTMGCAAFAGSLRIPLLVFDREEDTMFAALARWIPTLSWSVPLHILLAAHWLRSGKTLRENSEGQFGPAWLSTLAMWSAFGLLFLGTVSHFTHPQFLFQFGQLLIATFSGLILVGVAVGRYSGSSFSDPTSLATKRLRDEAALALSVGFALSLAAFAIEYWITFQNGIAATAFPDFASRTAFIAVVLQMAAIGIVPIKLRELTVWRRMLFVVPMLASPLLLSLAWQWSPVASFLTHLVGWLDARSIGVVIIAGLLSHAVVTFFYLPLARLDFAATSARQGQQWTLTFFVLRWTAYTLLVGVAIVTSVIFNEQRQVSIATGILSLTFLLWSFISAKTRWGVASVLMAMLSAIYFTNWRGYHSTTQVYFTATTAPVVVAWASVALGKLHGILARAWDVRRQGTLQRYASDWNRSYSIELLVAYIMPGVLGLTCLAITRIPSLNADIGVINHSIFLTIASYLLAVTLWLRRPSFSLLRLCYFASIPIFTLPMIWFSHQQELSNRMQFLFGIMGVSTGALFNSIAFHWSWPLIGIRLPQSWRRKFAALRTTDSNLWMHSVTTLVSIGLSVVTLIVVFVSSETQLRSIAAVVPLLGAVSLGTLSFRSTSKPEYPTLRQSRVALLVLITLAGMLVAIRDLGALDAIEDANGIAHLRRCFIAAAGLLWLYVFTASRRLFSDAWTFYLYRFGWLNYAIGLGFGLLVLLMRAIRPELEIKQTVLEEVLVFGAWIALVYRSLRFAMAPFANEIEQSIRQRSLAVYGIQALILGTGTEVYLDHPELFGSWLAGWWPVAVLIIALASVALGTITRLDQSAIFGGPTRQLNLMMPLVPLAGVWLTNENQFWQDSQVFGGLMLGAAILYGVQSWVYRSTLMQMVSIACGIISFWCFIFDLQWARIWYHPQLWLLPPAIAALYLIETNRRIFSRSILTAMRYVVILIAYLSSTADLMLMAFSSSFWMPLILMGLSIAGFLSGMVFRISALLICSVVFLFVSLVGMVWHAQQAFDQTWPWWVFGISSGIALLIALGYFEKNRAKVGEYLQQLRAWDAADA
jgi:hypothetical protein